MQLASVLRNDLGCLVPMCRFALALNLSTFMSLNNVTPSLLSKCYLLKNAENPHSTESDMESPGEQSPDLIEQFILWFCVVFFSSIKRDPHGRWGYFVQQGSQARSLSSHVR